MFSLRAVLTKLAPSTASEAVPLAGRADEERAEIRAEAEAQRARDRQARKRDAKTGPRAGLRGGGEAARPRVERGVDDPERMHQLMAATVDTCIAEIRRIKSLWPHPFVELADDNTFASKTHGRELLRALARENLRWFTETDLSIANDAHRHARARLGGRNHRDQLVTVSDGLAVVGDDDVAQFDAGLRRGAIGIDARHHRALGAGAQSGEPLERRLLGIRIDRERDAAALGLLVSDQVDEAVEEQS